MPFPCPKSAGGNQGPRRDDKVKKSKYHNAFETIWENIIFFDTIYLEGKKKTFEDTVYVEGNKDIIIKAML